MLFDNAVESQKGQLKMLSLLVEQKVKITFCWHCQIFPLYHECMSLWIVGKKLLSEDVFKVVNKYLSYHVYGSLKLVEEELLG